MGHIKRVSCFFRILFQVAFLITIIFTIMAWLQLPEPLHFFGKNANFVFSVIPKHLPILEPLRGTQKLCGFVLGLIPLAVHLAVLYYLIRLFSLYEEGKIFFMENVIATKRIGLLLALQQIINPLYEIMITPVLTWYNPVGQRVIEADFSNSNVGLLIMGLMIILVSWIMAEGCKLREEHDLTV